MFLCLMLFLAPNETTGTQRRYLGVGCGFWDVYTCEETGRKGRGDCQGRKPQGRGRQYPFPAYTRRWRCAPHCAIAMSSFLRVAVIFLLVAVRSRRRRLISGQGFHEPVKVGAG